MTAVSLNHRLKIKWLVAALDLMLDLEDHEEVVKQVEAMVRSDLKGEESFRKSIRYIRHLILEPTGEFVGLRNEAISIYKKQRTLKVGQIIAYFLIMAQYPYLREVAGVCGKLFNIQTTIKTEQIRRKMIELHGDRELIRRSSRNAISILSDLELLVPSAKKGIYESSEVYVFDDITSAEFALKAWFLSFKENAHRSKSSIINETAFFAIDSSSLVSFALRGKQFSLSRQSYDEDVVSLK